MTMKVTLRHYQGKVSKKATIRSNDSRDPELVVKMEGVVIPIIDIKPSMNILFRGMADQTQRVCSGPGGIGGALSYFRYRD